MRKTEFLNDLFKNSIYPLENEITALHSDTSRIYNMARQNTILKGFVNEIFKGGSYGRKTIIKDRYEGDLVLFLNKAVSNTKYDDLRGELEKQMKVLFQKDKNYKITKNPITIQLYYKNRELDILIGYKSTTEDKVAEFIEKGQKIYGAGSGPFQRKFLVDLNKKHPGIHDAIRLAKYWLKKYPISSLSKGEFPNSYAMELMVCYHIDKVYKGMNDLDVWFMAFLSWFYSTSLIHPMVFVNSSYSASKSKAGVLIQDPGNPSENVAENWIDIIKFQKIAQNQLQKAINQIF